MKISFINECVLYTFLWSIYYLQGFLYSSGSLLSQGILLVLLMLSLYYMVITFNKYKVPAFLKLTAVFIGLFVIYFLTSYLNSTPIYLGFTMEQQASAVESLKGVLLSLSPVYAYYHFSKKGYITQRNIIYYFVAMLVLVTCQFIRNQNDMIVEATSMGIEQEEFTNNLAYNFLQLMPLLVFLNKKTIYQYAALVYIMVYLLIGMKRGAILLGIVCALYFIYQTYKKASRRGKSRILIATTIVAIVFASFAGNFINSSEYFQQRVEDTIAGDSSNRDIIYSSLFQHLLSRNTIGDILFGGGLNHTVVVVGCYAHNDWLELGVNMGFLGIFIYLLYFASLGINIFQVQKSNKTAAVSLALCFIIMFVSTVFSMSYNSISIGMTLALGINLSQVGEQRS